MSRAPVFNESFNLPQELDIRHVNVVGEPRLPRLGLVGAAGQPALEVDLLPGSTGELHQSSEIALFAWGTTSVTNLCVWLTASGVGGQKTNESRPRSR